MWDGLPAHKSRIMQEYLLHRGCVSCFGRSRFARPGTRQLPTIREMPLSMMFEVFRENTSEQLQNTTPSRCQIVLKAHEYNNIRVKSTPELLFFSRALAPATELWGAVPAATLSQSSNLKYCAFNHLRRLLFARRGARSSVMGTFELGELGVFSGRRWDIAIPVIQVSGKGISAPNALILHTLRAYGGE